MCPNHPPWPHGPMGKFCMGAKYYGGTHMIREDYRDTPPRGFAGDESGGGGHKRVVLVEEELELPEGRKVLSAKEVEREDLGETRLSSDRVFPRREPCSRENLPNSTN